MTPDDLTTRRPVVRWQAGGEGDARETLDDLAVEEPLEIRIGSRAVSVTMRTPGHDIELAAGFLRSEGIIQTRADLLDLSPCQSAREGNVVTARLAPQVDADLSRLTRHVFASSSCGICGKASIDAIYQQCSPAIATDVTIKAEVLLMLPHKLRSAQAGFDRTGGLHAAGLFSTDGELIAMREDIGRHNAVDKLLGFGLLHQVSFEQLILMVSGRVSFEIMQKALAGQIPIVAAVSAPSSLAVDFAETSGQTLVGFLREGRMNLYCHPSRII